MLLGVFFIIYVTNSLFSTCWASPSDPSQVASALISMSDMSDMEFLNDMENVFEGFIGNQNDFLFGLPEVAAGVEEEQKQEEEPKEEEDPKQEEETKNEDEIINEKEQIIEEEPKKEEEQGNEIKKLVPKEVSTPTNATDEFAFDEPEEGSTNATSTNASSTNATSTNATSTNATSTNATSPNATVEFAFDEIYKVIKMVEVKDHDNDCDDACNNTYGCAKWTHDENGNCELHHFVPMPECLHPYKPVGRTCIYVAENYTKTWEEAWAICKKMDGRLLELGIHLNEPKRLIDIIEESHSEIGKKGLWLGADTFDPPEWHWNTTGTPLDDDFPWGVGKPVGTYQQLWRECLQISCNDEGVCQYEDEKCNNKHPYICEQRPKEVRRECYPPFVWMDGQCILFLEQRVTFGKAVERCRRMKGHLFQPKSPEIFKQYITARYGTPRHPRGIWLGAQLEKLRWVWTGSGKQVHHNFPWGKEKEDPTRREAEECMVVYANRGMPFTYDDANCLTKAFFVCESQKCEPPYEKFGDRCLLVIEERRNWEDAQESCMMDYNGRLAEINDPQKFIQFMHENHCKKRVFLKKAAKISCPPTVEYDPEDYQQEYWLGARAKKILWRWNATGQVIPLDFPWGENEPSGAYNGYPEECLNLFSNGKYSWKYNDAHCSRRFFFACELPDTSIPANLSVGNIFLGFDSQDETYAADEYGRATSTHLELEMGNSTDIEEEEEEEYVMPEGAECKDNNVDCYAWSNKGWCDFKEVKSQCWLSCELCSKVFAH